MPETAERDASPPVKRRLPFFLRLPRGGRETERRPDPASPGL